MSGDDAKLITFQVEPCRQKILDLHYPGQNRKCMPQSAIMPYIKDLEITVGVLTQYFNQDKLDEEPIKDSINMDIYMMVNTNLYQQKNFKISSNQVTLYDSWATDLLAPDTK